MEMSLAVLSVVALLPWLRAGSARELLFLLEGLLSGFVLVVFVLGDVAFVGSNDDAKTCVCVSLASVLPWLSAREESDLLMFLKGSFLAYLLLVLVAGVVVAERFRGHDEIPVERFRGHDEIPVEKLDDLGVALMPFGKHRGKPLKEVPHGYFRWMESSGAMRPGTKVEAYWRKKKVAC